MNMYLDKVFCANCLRLQSYSIRTEKVRRSWNDIECEYNKRIAYCDCCGKRISVPGLDDLNENEFDIKCREENGYIQVSEIKDIMARYNVEKRPLSLALGLGEHTIENYLKGQLPNKRYSELLKRVLLYYTEMQKLFVQNGDKINDHASKKIKERLDYYAYINSHSTTIEKVTIYVLNSKYEITNMSLQKLLYYIEAYCQVILHERIFDNRCEAWAYGPVYPEVYEKYKSFGRERIQVDPVDLNDEIDDKYRKLIDYVLNLYAIYNGVTLMDLSHAEEPWKKAHLGYGDKERCEEVISHESITDYFTAVSKRYDLRKEVKVKQYIMSLGVI